MEVSSQYFCLFLIVSIQFQVDNVLGLLFGLGQTSMSEEEVQRRVEQIRFFYYPKPFDRREIKLNDGHSLMYSDLKEDAPTVIMMDGFRTNLSSPMLATLSTAFLNTGRYGNVIALDWTSLSGFEPGADNDSLVRGALIYFNVINNLEVVAERLALFMGQLFYQKRISFKDFHLVGMSLGAHLAGIAGNIVMEKYDSQIGRISGLDPATTLIPIRLTRLRRGSAGFVDMYHTNRGLLGERDERTGDVNVYVNGGAKQPGCEDRDFEGTGLPGLCSHTYAWQFYDATFKRDFFGCSCVRFECQCSEDCDIPCPNPILVGVNIPLKARGTLHLRTQTIRI